MSQIYHFDISSLSSDSVDETNSVIRGVSVITNGVTARGHNLEVDDKTLEQLLECAQSKGKVPVKYNHQSGVENVGGYLFNFRIEGKKLKADWQLMRNHKETPATIEKAKEMPGCFGLSAAFMGKEETKGLKKFARCTELISVDCVAQPAANPEGLFSAKVDSSSRGMADTELTTEQKLLAQLTELTALVTKQQEQISNIQEFNAQLVEFADEEDEDEDEDEEDESEEDEDDGEGDESEGEGEEGEGAELSSIEAALNYLEAKAVRGLSKEKAAQESHAFAEVEARIIALAELNEQLQAENEALNLALKQGNGRAATAGVGESLKLFQAVGSDVTEFEARVTELTKEGKTKSQAVELAQKEDSERYADHLRAKGVIK